LRRLFPEEPIVIVAYLLLGRQLRVPSPFQRPSQEAILRSAALSHRSLSSA
jgi:hypothetical protein